MDLLSVACTKLVYEPTPSQNILYNVPVAPVTVSASPYKPLKLSIRYFLFCQFELNNERIQNKHTL